jgi:hypothetical protein
MGSQTRGQKRSLEQYEAYSVLSNGCRHLALTCVTRGAQKILQRLADQFDRQAKDVKDVREPAFSPAGIAGLASARVGVPPRQTRQR